MDDGRESFVSLGSDGAGIAGPVFLHRVWMAAHAAISPPRAPRTRRLAVA